MATKLEPEKKVDLPPKGRPQSPTRSPMRLGSHPIETGIGAAVVGGAASGMAVGAVAGPGDRRRRRGAR